MLGAEGIQTGTAFLAYLESGAHEAYREAGLAANEEVTAVTCGFPGEPTGGIRSLFVEEMEEVEISGCPVQNAYTRDVRATAIKAVLGGVDVVSRPPSPRVSRVLCWQRGCRRRGSGEGYKAAGSASRVRTVISGLQRKRRCGGNVPSPLPC